MTVRLKDLEGEEKGKCLVWKGETKRDEGDVFDGANQTYCLVYTVIN